MGKEKYMHALPRLCVCARVHMEGKKTRDDKKQVRIGVKCPDLESE